LTNMRHVKYQCPRCHYSTDHKGNMRKHFGNKKACPATAHDIELTDAIKEYVLLNRVYRIPMQPTVTQIINNNTLINNYIAGMDTVDKLTMYLDRTQQRLSTFDTRVSSTFEENVDHLETSPPVELRNIIRLTPPPNDLLKVIDVVSRLCSDVCEMNLLFDSKSNKLRFYQGKWEEHLLDNGILALIYTIQEYFWDAYEVYLANKTWRQHNREGQRCKELLQEYYKFLACFNAESAVRPEREYLSLDVEEDDATSEAEAKEHFSDLYDSMKAKVTKSDVSKFRKEVISILKRNTVSNVETLNKKVCDLFQMDADFKARILELH